MLISYIVGVDPQSYGQRVNEAKLIQWFRSFSLLGLVVPGLF